MIEGSALLLFAAALFINASAPGPSIAALVARVVARGARDALPFLMAMWIGEGLWLAAAAFGMAAVAQSFHVAFSIIKFCGIVYLLYLAWHMWIVAGEEIERQHSLEGSPLQLFFAGLSITLGNPKIMVFYLALLPSIIDVTAIDAVGFAALIVTMMAVLMSVDMAWVLLAFAARRLLSSKSAIKIANRCGAAAMGGAAAALAAR